MFSLLYKWMENGASGQNGLIAVRHVGQEWGRANETAPIPTQPLEEKTALAPPLRTKSARDVSAPVSDSIWFSQKIIQAGLFKAFSD